MIKEQLAVPSGEEKGGEIINIEVARYKKLIRQMEESKSDNDAQDIWWTLKQEIKKMPKENQKQFHDLLTQAYFKDTNQGRSYLNLRRAVLDVMDPAKALKIVQDLIEKDDNLAWTDLESLELNWKDKLKEGKLTKSDQAAIREAIDRARSLMDQIDEKQRSKREAK